MRLLTVQLLFLRFQLNIDVSISFVFTWYGNVQIFIISTAEIICFDSIHLIKENSLRILKKFYKNDFKAYFDDRKKRCQKCIAVWRDYFEEDAIHFDQ